MSQQLATREATDLRLVIQNPKIQEQLIAALPQHYTPSQFTVIVRTAINKNPKLAECDQSSFLTAMLTAAQMGLAPDGRNGHLIPRWNKKSGKMEATFQPDYKGLVSLVRKTENVSDIYAETVHDNDTFRITKGLHRDLIHEVDVRAERGDLIGVYAVIAYKDGTNSFEFMSKPEIEAIRKRSQSPDFGPWQTDYSEMAKKTVIKRLLKLADISPETAERISHDPENLPAPSIEIKAAPAPVASVPAISAPAQAPAKHLLLEETPQAEPEVTIEATPVVAEVIEEDNIPMGDPSPFGDDEPKKATASRAKKESPKPAALSPEIAKIHELLAEEGKSEEQLMALLSKEGMTKPGQPLSELPKATLNNLIKYWGEIQEGFSKAD